MKIQWKSAFSNSLGTSKKVRDSGKFKILTFYKVLGKPNTVFSSVLTLVIFKGEKYVDILTVIGIYFRLK